MVSAARGGGESPLAGAVGSGDVDVQRVAQPDAADEGDEAAVGRPLTLDVPLLDDPAFRPADAPAFAVDVDDGELVEGAGFRRLPVTLHEERAAAGRPRRRGLVPARRE